MLFLQAAVLAAAALPFAFAQISNDFESGWDQTAWPIYAPDCNSGGNVSLDSTTAHSGTHSMKVSSPGGYCGHIFFGTTQVPATGDVFVRVWLKATTALTTNHISFIVMPDTAEGTNEHLRIGGQDQILMYNRQVDDATLPEMSPQGVATSVALPVGSFQCLEYHLGTNGSIETWLNSAAIPGLFTANNPNDQGWSASTIIPKITGVYFGWESYGGDANTFWYDDVAIASSRIGCGTSGSSGTTSVASSSSTKASSSSNSKPASSTSTTSSKATTSTTLTTSVKSTTTTTTSSSSKAATTTSTSTGATVPLYGQCGGMNWTGGTVCAAGSTCTYYGAYYSQCTVA